MSRRTISDPEEIKAFMRIWEYLRDNGKLFVLVYYSSESVKVYAEVDTETKTKTIRVFLDNESIKLYMKNAENKIIQNEKSDGALRVGAISVKLLQKQLTAIYGTAIQDDIMVECLLTTYDKYGNMQDIDIIWTQFSN